VVYNKVCGGEVHMENKPLHYDGSVQNLQASTSDTTAIEPFKMTDEMRANVSGNPYMNETVK
jgi:hypothetical protein